MGRGIVGDRYIGYCLLGKVLCMIFSAEKSCRAVGGITDDRLGVSFELYVDTVDCGNF